MNRPLAFDVCTVREADRGSKTIARFSCARCDAKIDFRIASGTPLNPDGLVKRGVEHGWRTDARSRAGNLCPACLAAKPPNDTDSELTKRMSRMAAAAVSPFPQQPAAPNPAPAPVPASPPKPTPTSVLASASPDQRRKVRLALEEHFDDKSGTYLGGMNDQRIADAVGIPRAIVEGLREAAFGPIRENPAITKLRDELAGFAERLETWEAAGRALRTQEAAFLSRLDALAKAANSG
jgi:hypothetical protein